MTDAFNTLREMLDGVPDDAQVYVEEREIVTEWPGITAGTFRQLLAEIEGFEAMWEQREKAHEAALAEIAGTCTCTSGIHDGLCMKGCRGTE